MSSFLKILPLLLVFLSGCGEITSSSTPSHTSSQTQSPTPAQQPLDIQEIPQEPQEQIIHLDE